MSAQEIIAELPKLKPEEIRLLKAKVDELAGAEAQNGPVHPNPPRVLKAESLGDFFLRVAGTAEEVAGRLGGKPRPLPVRNPQAPAVMKRAFGDSFFFIALLNARDFHHQRVVAFSRDWAGWIITTRWVLAETANALCGARAREFFELSGRA